MKKNNIYNKYCTCMQNHGLGSYAIVAFCSGYKSVTNEVSSILNLFIVIPMVMNETIRLVIRGKNDNEGVKQIDTLISNKIYDKKTFIGAFYNLISAYKNYTMTSIIFGLRTGLLTLDLSGKIDTNISFDSIKNKHHIYQSAYKLGLLFGQDKNAMVKLLHATGVSLWQIFN